MTSLIILALVSFTLIYIFLWATLLLTQDKKEPPLAKTSFPFLAPVVGMVRGGSNFYLDQRDKHNVPIYTLRLPFQKIYVINSTNLIPALQKQWRLISFASLFAGAGKVVGMSDSACDIMHEHLTDETKNFNYTWVARVSSHLSLGSKGLDEMNRVAVGVLSEEIDELARNTQNDDPKDGAGTVIGLQEWVFRTMLLATTDAVYGVKNPFRDAAVAKAWNTVEINFLTLVLSPLPKFLTDIFIHKVIQARETVVSAFLDYIKKDGTRTASTLLQTKHAHHREKFTNEDIARTDIALSFAILGNTNPAAWWVIYHIFSDPIVLKDIRDELLSTPGLVTYTKFESASTVASKQVQIQEEMVECTVNLSNLRSPAKNCPIIHSTLTETLRHRTVSNSVRKVLEQDILLNNHYLLKKGSLVMLPHAVQHTSTQAFGDNTREFDHLRFFRDPQGKGKGASGLGLDKRAFYAFGGGHETCPGRHFASAEIMALAALMVLRFDIEPVEMETGKGKGKWVEPSCEKSPMASGLPYPDEETFVRVRERDWLPVEEKYDEKKRRRRIVKWRACYSGSETAPETGAGREARKLGVE